MVCSRCGSNIPVSANSCPRCSASRLRTTATGLQTPPPPITQRSDTARLAEGDAPTIFSLPPPASSADLPPPASSAADGGQTIGPGLGHGADIDPELTIQPGSAGTTSSDNGPLDIGSAFGARYHIIRLLGIGGMGAVYQAWDAELGVAVAIKVIRPEVMADPTAAAEVERRFKRELLLARQVTHKNVVRIHDIGEMLGIKYITMPYVDGADLATVSRNEGRLPIPRILRIARGIVSGLVAAHTASVVHRDLKPANIMIGLDDEAMIMDFGIALSSGAPSATATVVEGLPTHFTRSAAKFSTTMAGAVVGTVEYMAPEQARGQQVDQRADVYAFGLILYDLLVGRRRAEHAPSAIAELQGRMEHPPPPPRSVLPEIPEALDQLVARCLEPDREKRYQTSAELAADIERLDENGVPIPLPRRFTPRMIAAAVVLVAALVTGTWWLTRTPPVPKKHDPVTVVIADFQNNTSDSTFDHTLEPMLRRALESAGFISAYDRNRIRGTFGVQPPAKLDEAAARQLAVNQGLGVVLSGSIDRQGSGYEIAVQAAQTITGKVVVSAKRRASNKDQVLGAATKLVTTVRKALGDETSDSAQLFAMRGVSATSLEVFRHYAAAMEAQSDGKIEEARLSYQKTVELDPNFGLGYQGLAFMSRNLGKLEDADKYTAEALKHLEGLTDRERFAVRASYYVTTGDLHQCVKEYGELIAQYPADSSGHNNRGVCLSKLRNMREATEEMRQAVQILPKRVSLRANLAMFGNYSGDFETAERDARAIQEPNDMAILALAFSQLGQGLIPEATETYQKLETMSARGKSWAASGLADVATYEGRFSDAARLFEQGAALDLASKNGDRAARKLTSAAYAHLMRGQKGAAIAAAEKALLNSKALPIRFLAARVFVEAGAVAKAQTQAVNLAKELPAEPHAYGKIIEGEIALKNGDAREAIKILTDASGVLDTWLGHFDLGRAYLELRAFPQADSEFDRCIKRRGEAMSLLVDEEQTYGYFPTVFYYQGLVREGLKSARSVDSYREYLKIRGKSAEDPFLPEVRRRVGQ
jgi:serine/threonine protein kinase/Flp pilus assembly protein TadD